MITAGVCIASYGELNFNWTVGFGHVDHTGCHELASLTKRRARVVALHHSRGCQIGYYVEHTGSTIQCVLTAAKRTWTILVLGVINWLVF